MKLTSLFSGSSGNCLLVEHNNTTLLIDAGLPGNRIQAMLAVADVIPERWRHLVTHEHSDHISGIGVLSRRYQMRFMPIKNIFGHAGENRENTGWSNPYFDSSRSFIIKDLEILPFRTPHDAAEFRRFRINGGEESLAVATDIGSRDDRNQWCVTGMQIGVSGSESWYDMLMNGRIRFIWKNGYAVISGICPMKRRGHFVVTWLTAGREKLCSDSVNRTIHRLPHCKR